MTQDKLEKSPPSILIPKTLLLDIEEKLSNSKDETGFYIIGLIDDFNRTAIVLDYFEFQYNERNRTFIESDPQKKILLLQSLPIGLKLIGNIHSHPFLERGFLPHPSSIDISTYKDYLSGFFGISNSYGELAFYYNDGKKLIEAKYQSIEDKRILNNLITIKLEGHPVFYHKDYSENFLRSMVYEGLYEKKLLLLSLTKIIINNEKIEVKWPKWLDIVKIGPLIKIPYRIYYHDNKLEVLRHKIGIMFNKAKFYNDRMEEIDLDNIEDLGNITRLFAKCR